MIPHLVIVTDRFIPPEFSARAIAFVILVRPSCRDNAALIAHELVHVKQWWRAPVISDILYMCSSHYRYKYELEAYREQLKLDPLQTMFFTAKLYANYSIKNKTFAEVYADMTAT